jgi:N6-adenosine-specific RNA methylase IME4
MKYRTIAVDPPWPYANRYAGTRSPDRLRDTYKPVPMPYPTMSLAEIGALPVTTLAADAAHLYLWTTQRFLRAGFDIIDQWGFTFSTILVWSKKPKGIAGTFVVSTEFVLFARRGVLAGKRRQMGTVFAWPRNGVHSRKPDHFYDLVESVSPGPYVELFSRRHRLGWDVWGDESANTAQLVSA